MPEPQPQGLLAKTQMPNFSILGMLMGGRGYASDWFSTRDKLNLAQAEQATEAQNRQSSVNQLTGGPNMAAVVKDPYSMQNQINLWRESQQANIDPKTGQVITGLFERGMQNIYGRQDTIFGNKLQRENMDYANQLQRGNTDYAHKLNLETMDYGQKIAQDNAVFNANLGIKTDQEKQALDAENEQKSLMAAFPDSPGIWSALIQSRKMKDAGVAPESGTLPATVKGPDGQPMLVEVPMAGSGKYNEQWPKILAQSQLTGMIDEVVKNIDSGHVYTPTEIEELRLHIGDQYRQAKGLGTLDADTKALLAEMFPPSVTQGGPWSQAFRNSYSEKWRVASMVAKSQLSDMRRYFVMPVDVNASPLGGTRTQAQAAAAAAEAKKLDADQQKQIGGPQSNPRFGAPKVTGGQTGKGGGSIWNPSATTRTGGKY